MNMTPKHTVLVNAMIAAGVLASLASTIVIAQPATPDPASTQPATTTPSSASVPPTAPAAHAAPTSTTAPAVAATQVTTPAPAAKPEAARPEKISVTGSRIAAPNLDSASPIASVDARAIKAEGVRNVESLLNNLPQVFADQGGSVSNGATGIATVNLRGLGPSRTLVLVNGRRMPAGSPAQFATDLNQIPAPLIKRIDVLTGGGGAVYGSDAIAGVVNFVMNDKFEGVQIEANHSFYNHKQQNSGGVADLIAARARTNSAQFAVPGNKSMDGKSSDFSLLLGSNFDDGRGNATLFFNYKQDKALTQADRDFSACALGTSETTDTINTVPFGPGFRCGGSNTGFPGRFRIFTNPSLTAFIDRTLSGTGGNTRAFSSTLDQYNFAPTNYFVRPSERYSFNAFSHYDINNTNRIYTEASMHDDRTVAQIAPSGVFGIGLLGADAVRCDNPLLSADWRRDLGCVGTTGTANVLINRRNTEGGPRQGQLRHTSYRMVIGAKGELDKVWSYDAYLSEGKVIYQQAYQNDFSISRSLLALDVIRDASGNIVCRSGPPCVPYNIWAAGGVTPQALAYLQTPGLQTGGTEQKVQSVTLTGDLTDYGFKSPSAKGGVGVAFGLERRVEKLSRETDAAFSSGDLFGQGGPTIGLSGKYDVTDISAEVRAPLIEGAAFADLLAINASVRRSDYSFLWLRY
jgi:iron complex outermembrane recepter protein